jgi:hypothetical protein
MVRKHLILVFFALTVAGCTSAINLRNPATGATAQCGPYQLEGLGQPASVAERERRCLDDYQRLGFQRAP